MAEVTTVRYSLGSPRPKGNIWYQACSKLNQAEAPLNIFADTYFSQTEILAT
jgi:hypothetical protein